MELAFTETSYPIRALCLWRQAPANHDDPASFQIDETFSVPGIGLVVSGTAMAGTIRLNDTLMLGPDSLGHFEVPRSSAAPRKAFIKRLFLSSSSAPPHCSTEQHH